MSYYSDVCDKTIKLKPKNRHLKSLSHKKFNKYSHIKLNIKNLDKKTHNTVYEYLIEHNENTMTILSNVILEQFSTIANI